MNTKHVNFEALLELFFRAVMGAIQFFFSLMRKTIRIYDNIINRLVTAEEKGQFYSRREELGLLFPETATIAIRPLRIAFDDWNMKDEYVQSVRTAAAHGIKNLSNYLLYNFNDHPVELIS